MRLIGRRLLAIGTVAVAANLGLAPALAANERPAVKAPMCLVCGHNLISNPGAELGQGTNDDSVIKVIPGWAHSGGFTVAQYAWSGGDLSPTTPGPKNRGKNYFYGGPSSARSTGTQLIEIPRHEVPAAGLDFVLSGWLGGYDSQGDNATLYVSFQNGAGQKIAFKNATGVTSSSAQIGPVTEAQRKDVSELLHEAMTGQFPPSTRIVKVVLVFVRESGSDNDGLADNLSLVLSVPKPLA
jgi:hypothetical protein